MYQIISRVSLLKFSESLIKIMYINIIDTLQVHIIRLNAQWYLLMVFALILETL